MQQMSIGETANSEEDVSGTEARGVDTVDFWLLHVDNRDYTYRWS